MASEEGEQPQDDRSLSEWRAKLTALPQDHEQAEQSERERAVRVPSPRRSYVPRYAYQSARSLAPAAHGSEKKPLIDQVTNSWRDVKLAPEEFDAGTELDHGSGCCDLDDETSCPNTTRRFLRSRKFRRALMVLLGTLAALYYTWTRYLGPQFEEDWAFKEGFLPQHLNGTYGIARMGDFDGVRVKDLPSTLVPGGEGDTAGRRRLVFVGDIHGCRDELAKLLRKVGFDQRTDHLIATGDVVSKGPHNIDVLDELIRLGADSVRGNHEDLLLEAARTISDTDSTPPSEASSSRGAAKDAALLRRLHPRHLRYLRDMPLLLRIPALPLAHPSSHPTDGRVAESILVAHAGLVPHVPLGRQDPYFVMNMRSIHRHTHIPSATRGDRHTPRRPWYDLWAWYNARLARGRSVASFFLLDPAAAGDDGADTGLTRVWTAVFGARARPPPPPPPRVVVYGHDSKMGLQLHRWSKGLDSACVAGGQLTALVLDATGATEVVSVRCRDYRA